MIRLREAIDRTIDQYRDTSYWLQDGGGGERRRQSPFHGVAFEELATNAIRAGIRNRRLGVVSAIIAVVIFVFSSVLAAASPTQSEAVLSGILGLAGTLITGVIAAIFLALHKGTQEQLLQLHTSLTEQSAN